MPDTVRTPIDLEAVGADFERAAATVSRRVVICAGTGCVANGALDVYEAFRREIAATGAEVVVELRAEGDHTPDAVHVSKSGCQGFCQMGPLVSVLPEAILYVRIKADDVPEIVRSTLLEGEVIEQFLYTDPVTGRRGQGQAEICFYERQQRLVLHECGRIDPEDIREYIAHGGYAGARRAFTEMSPEEVCAEITLSGLRGRGGGGFPTGRKWDLTRLQPGDKKYVICNADEGDPGAFMDRSVMEGNPHSVIEGMMIAARAVGADEGFLYVRAEYPLAVSRVRRAVEDAQAAGLLGDDLFATGMGLRLHVMEGAGAFVCGEETALIASLEGKRGMPTPRPPFPAQRGLWGKPTLINNVETLATTPVIFRMGAQAFRDLGTETSSGTKTFALTGHVANTGLIEVPFGATLREIVFDIGGGVTDEAGNITGDGFKAVQIGGPSGGCLSEDMLDMPLDYDSLQAVGAMVGSGGLVVMNKATCMPAVARFFTEFVQAESCGKCVPCRVGTRRMLEILTRITRGEGEPGDIDKLERLGKMIKETSLCGLGQTAPNPVLSTIRHFRAEYEAHVHEKRCPAGVCTALISYRIDPEKCVGCTACAKACPVAAISGERKEAHVIDVATCTRCGACRQVCKFEAVIVG